jgi:uncharacterized protein YecT (DUF1311 family)
MEVDMNGKRKSIWAEFQCSTTIMLAMLLSGPCFGQQAPATVGKVPTAEQIVYQRQYHAFVAKRQSLQAQAKQVFDKEMAREKSGDCPDAKTTYEFNICYGKEEAITEQNLKLYESIIEGLQAPPPQMPGQTNTDVPRPGGPALTPKELSEEFERMEKVWQDYRETACTAAFHQFSGGTGGPSFELQCELKLTRDHMRELDLIYGGALHL